MSTDISLIHDEIESLPIETLVDFIYNLSHLLQDANKDNFSIDVETNQIINSFIINQIPSTLFIIKHLRDEKVHFTLANELTPIASVISTIVLIKGRGPLNKSNSLDSQIHTVNISNISSENNLNSFEILRSLINLGISPYFEILANNLINDQDFKINNDDSGSIGSTRKKINELSLSLQHLQQNIQIPDLLLNLNPHIAKAIEDAKISNKNSIDLIPEHLLSDSGFLNSLQNTVNNWIKNTQNVTKLNHEPSDGSTADEINFWISMENALLSIQDQLNSEGIQLTLEVLRNAKRFHATVSFLSDTGIKEAIISASKYNQLLKDFPIDEILSATTFKKLEEGIILVFNHLKKLRVTQYPINRALILVESISIDIDLKLKSIIRNSKLMYLNYNEFEFFYKNLTSIFEVLDKQLKDFISLARELLRKRSEKFIFVRVNNKTILLQEKIEYITTFRKRHQDLISSITHIINSTDTTFDKFFSDNGSLIDLEYAYDSVRQIDISDTSNEGKRQWDLSEKIYNTRAQKVENSIVLILRDILSNSRNSNEMFSIFEKFSFLIDRPSVRSAIQEYQTQLLDIVKSDIHNLQEYFTKQDESRDLSILRDIPVITSALIWAKQIEHRLDFLVNRLELILGKNWTQYAEGQRIHAETVVFKRKLNTSLIYDNWLSEIMKRGLTIEGPIFKIVSNLNKSSKFDISVNFDDMLMSVFKEVRNLCWLGYNIPHSIISNARLIRKVYPHAISLNESLLTFKQTVTEGESLEEFQILLQSDKQAILNLMKECFQVKWELLARAYDLQRIATSDLEDLAENKSLAAVNNLQESVYDFLNKTDFIKGIKLKLSKLLSDLVACEYNPSVYSSILLGIQKIVNDIILEGFSNVSYLVNKINMNLEKILLDRCLTEISSIVQALANENYESQFVPKCRHEIVFQDQSLVVSPHIDTSKIEWIMNLQKCVRVVQDQKLIDSSSFEVRVTEIDGSYAKLKTFSSIVEKASKEIDSCLLKIDDTLNYAKTYVSSWYQFQTLWDIQPEDVYNYLGIKIDDWIKVLGDIRSSRQTFDTVETTRCFGPIIIDYEQVQARINAQYDIWQRQVINKFAETLNLIMKEVNSEILISRKELEDHVDFTSTESIVKLVTNTHKYKESLKYWTEQLGLYEHGQTLLLRNRFRFPTDWLHCEQVESDVSSLQEILNRRDTAISQQMDVIGSRIKSEVTRVQDSMTKIKEQWSQKKPISGTLNPKDAIATLDFFDQAISKLQNNKTSLLNASRVLSLPVLSLQDLSATLDEIKDFKSVWSSIDTLWNGIQDLRRTNWKDVAPRAVRRQLDELLSSSRNMPSRIRQYAAFEQVQDIIKSFVKSNSIISDLKTEAMRTRHWQLLFKKLNLVDIPIISLSLGDIWDMNVLLNEAIIKGVLLQANGEKAIEDTLSKIKDGWAVTTLELFGYQIKYRLVKGWDALFEHCNEDIGSLSTMHHSSFYKIFEPEATHWENKLNKLYVLLDTWIDVQRQWIYLDGVFGDNNDIKRLLPIESSRFQNISSEFFILLKNIYKVPLVIDILDIADIQQTMERTFEVLIRVRKALSDYLEKQREIFPRFYFVGNEDLLEIIGGGDDISKVGKNLKKMFAGISDIEYVRDSCTIVSVRSDQGEVVLLSNPVSLIKFPRLHEWLSELELEVRTSLSLMVEKSLLEFTQSVLNENNTFDLISWCENYPVQVCVLTTQIAFTNAAESCMKKNNLNFLKDVYIQLLDILASEVLKDFDLLARRKVESLIIEFLHQRDIIEQLIVNNVNTSDNFVWKSNQLYYYDSSSTDPLTRLTVEQAGAVFTYGFEYLGSPEKLAYTPLIDKCFLTMTQALDQRLGGSPFGPAGTGKTESIKALGNNLGKMVLVFCCDESFDFQSMGRILIGLCKVGAWGCFDEFNRLNEKILSAVSSQIEKIESGLSLNQLEIELLGKKLSVNPETGIFITMNPGYAGRSSLPENLKKLFRSFSMEKPDREIITEVVLNSQGFTYASMLAARVVPFFLELESKCSQQTHYDFGLRALKHTLINCGMIKRKKILSNEHNRNESFELKIILQGLRETVAAKLITSDEKIMRSLESTHFGEVEYETSDYTTLIESLRRITSLDGLECSEEWLLKALQLYQIQENHHGIMLVGETGVGKTVMWKSLLKAISTIDSIDNVSYVIDCKVMSKDDLYGSLDSATRDWSDGLFTSILRRISANLRGELSKRIWIVFDGDVDPDWVENLNSVLDDNKILTLPNGERLALPSNVRLVFEVDNLKYATPATVSRCGMVWLGEDIIGTRSLMNHYFHHLETVALDIIDDNFNSQDPTINLMDVQRKFKSFVSDKVDFETMNSVISKASLFSHLMTFDKKRALNTFFTMINTYCRRLLQFLTLNTSLIGGDFDEYNIKAIILSFIWAFSGDSKADEREALGNFLLDYKCFDCIKNQNHFSLVEYDVSLPDGVWVPWSNRVPFIDLEVHSVSQPDVVVPTTDTLRHEDLIYSILNEHQSLLLCGPPGSGKTMTLFGALRKSANLDVVGINFSKESSPDLLMKTLEQYCEYKKTNAGIALAPKVPGKWLVVFCDEINLPAIDKYGTQRIISLMRQMIEQKGFWRRKDKQWVSLVNIQFVGACNPPDDPGRNKLSSRFLRHACLILVDYPGRTSLNQIYDTFNSAILKCVPTLRGYSSVLTESMVTVYFESREKFDVSIQPHYIYSPRELTRWVRGMMEVLKLSDGMTLSDLVRLWAHEGFRLFYDRLVDEEERIWTKNLIHQVAKDHFPGVDISSVLREPILFSNWLSLKYLPVEHHQLRDFVAERLRVFSEEEFDVSLILYDDLLDHVLRIDRVLKQPQGHLILVGPSTSGKTTLSRFVSWINGLKVVQMNVHRKYNLSDFDNTLRDLLKRTGVFGEKICFLIDESSIMETSFLERMNTLLANAEVPGLFEGDDFNALMNLCMDQSQKQGLLLDTSEELYKWFTQQVAENLHVVFTTNNPKDSSSPQIIASPALFNRCVLNWMGDWSNSALFQVASEMIHRVPLDMSTYTKPTSFKKFVNEDIIAYRDVIVDAAVYFHRKGFNNHSNSRTPGQFMEFMSNFTSIFKQKESELQEHQRHISMGLDKLRDTVLKVKDLKESLSIKKAHLEAKDKEAKAMLSKMLTDQNEAERKQEFSVDTQLALAKQEVEVSQRRESVMKDLELAEPAVMEAQKGVQNIKKQHLTEIRSMANPPIAVKVTMESVCILLGYDVSTWRDVQSIIRRDDFITSIVDYNNEAQLTPEIRHYMEDTYLTRDDYNFSTVDRASKACGPLLQWVLAQITYSSILERIGPLRDEVYSLENEAKSTKSKLIAIDEMIKELQESIEKYKENYSLLIRDTENIKTEMSGVQSKVERSVKLLESLTEERSRWSDSVHRFGKQRECLAGDSLLSAAFTVYCGHIDQKARNSTIKVWKQKLTTSGVIFDSNIRMIDYLGSPDKILKWHSNGLPKDSLFVENFITMSHCEYPFIIDPSGTTIDVLTESLLPSKLIVTSFLDNGFVRQLENALRFGGSILIQDGEHFDPIISRILSRDFKKNGGRVLVQLGKQEVDIAHGFKLFIHTRDPSVAISSFVSSRATVINFTITKSSLENQILNATLRKERPEIEERRLELMKLNGEYKVRLYNLEEQLLTSLSDSRGNILDNDEIVATLEELKAESNEITSKMQETSTVMATVEEVLDQYQPVASHSSKIFSLLESLQKLNRFYNFSLKYFTKAVDYVLSCSSGDTDRVQGLVKKLYQEIYSRTSISLLSKDKIVFAVSMVICFYDSEENNRFKKVMLLILNALKSSDSEIIGNLFDIFKNLSVDVNQETIETFFKDPSSINEFVPDGDDNMIFERLKPLIKSIANSGGNSEEFMSCFTSLSSFLFSGVGPYSSNYELNDVVKQSSTSGSIILCSPEGYDATFKVERLASDTNINLSIVAMGSNEGIEIVNSEIGKASKEGYWVLVQNVQMAADWLEYLEKQLASMNPAKKFRLFLTCSLTSTIPTTLIRSSSILVYENLPGIKNMMIETFNSIPEKSLVKTPIERTYVYLLLVWYHSVIQERLRFVPIGFTKKYEVNFSDLEAGLFVVDRIFDRISSDRTNVAPESIPWFELQYLVNQIVYGSKFDKKEDLTVLSDLAQQIFTVESFNVDFNLIKNAITSRLGTTLSPPEGRTVEAYISWIKSLPDHESPTWYGLDEQVEEVIRVREGRLISQTILDIHDFEELA